MTMFAFPCCDCEQRRPGCHDSCGKYRAVKDAREARNELQRRSSEASAYTKDEIYKNRRTRRGKS